MTTKETVLSHLRSDSFCSGESLAKESGVSRVAVWKAINSLRAEGWKIVSSTNKGYKLESRPDKLDDAEIRAEILKNGVDAGRVFVFDSIDSTNNEAKRQCANVGAFRKINGELTDGGKNLHRALFVAQTQTLGRGRTERTFESPANAGAYFSLVYAPTGGVRDSAILTAAAAVAVCRALDSLFGTDAKIKWVNDIFLKIDGKFKKIVGILTEGVANFENDTIECAVVGIGINVKKSDFSPELAKKAGSLEEFFGNDWKNHEKTRNEIVSRVISELLKIYDANENILEEYRARSLLTGRRVFVNTLALGEAQNGFDATVEGIGDGAELLVKTSDGKKIALRSGEVTLHETQDF